MRKSHIGIVFYNIRKQLFVAIILLICITFVLATILYIAENKSNAEAFDCWWGAMWWVLSYYVGNPGNIAQHNPLTMPGRMVAFLTGVVEILLFAVVMGFIITLIEEMLRTLHIRECEKKIVAFFKPRSSRFFHYRAVRPYVSVVSLQERLLLAEKDIIDAVNASHVLRLRNLVDAELRSSHPQDRLVVERIPSLNTVYGCFVNRESSVTIICPTAVNEPGIGNFSWYVAQIGGFNYVSREVRLPEEEDISYYNILDKDHTDSECRQKFLKDVKNLTSLKDHWAFIFISTGDQNQNCHFVYGAEQGDTTYDGPHITVQDKKRLGLLLENIEKKLTVKNVSCVWSGRKSRKNSLERIIGQTSNALTIRLAYKTLLWHDERMNIAEAIACSIQEVLDSKPAQLRKWTSEEGDGYGYIKQQ